VAAELGAPFARTLLDRLASESPPPGDPWPESCLSALVRLLGQGEAALPVLETLDQRGLLVRLLPEWEPVRSRPQRNAYHRFTVDRHLWDAAMNAAALTRRVGRPDLLLLGALLHDIGKGVRDRDHTEAGIELVGIIGKRMGLPTDDVRVLEALVEHHLLLADTATRRDLDDPRTITSVAAAVGDVATLELLAALTEADSLATGPSAWGAWKAGLVETLVDRVQAVLEESPRAAAMLTEHPSFPSESDRALMAAGRFEFVAEPPTVTVVAPDRPGLLASVAGTLAVRGVSVRAAHAASDGTMAVEAFEVEPAVDRFPDWDKVKADVAAALDGRLGVERLLAERAQAYAAMYRVRAARPPEVVVLFDDEASATATVIEVRAPDGVGVLYRITNALAGCGLDVRSAKVLTLGHEVVDTFYVNPVRVGERPSIEAAVLAALDATPPA
jgi:[protein-PII] uridylyltransferase